MSMLKHEIDFLDEINSKYQTIEDEIEKKLHKLRQEELKYEKEELIEDQDHSLKNKCNSFQEAKQRNSEILKAFEMTKARLRSRSTFSPIEMILKKAKKNYMKEYSLIPISKSDLNT